MSCAHKGGFYLFFFSTLCAQEQLVSHQKGKKFPRHAVGTQRNCLHKQVFAAVLFQNNPFYFPNHFSSLPRSFPALLLCSRAVPPSLTSPAEVRSTCHSPAFRSIIKIPSGTRLTKQKTQTIRNFILGVSLPCGHKPLAPDAIIQQSLHLPSNLI